MPTCGQATANEVRLAELQRNLASFYPGLVHGFLDTVHGLGGPAAFGPGELDVVARLVVGTQAILLPRSAAFAAKQRGELTAFSSLAVRLHEAAPLCAASFARHYPSFPYPLAALQAPLSAYAASQAPRKDTRGRLLEWVWACADPAERAAFLDGFAAFSDAMPGLVLELAKILETRFANRPLATAASWLKRGFGFVGASRLEEASDHFLLQSRESRACLGLTGAVLREEQNVLRIFTASLRDEGCNVVPLGVSAFGQTSPYTDGLSLFLPGDCTAFPEDSLNRRTYSALAALLCGLLNEGTFGFSMERIDFGYELADRYGSSLPPIKPELVRRYAGKLKAIRERRGNILELIFKTGRALVVLETDLEKFWYSFPEPWFAEILFSAFELARVEASTRRRYAGLDQDFARMNRLITASLPPLPDRCRPDSLQPPRATQEGFFEAIRLFQRMRLGFDAPPGASPFADSLASAFASVRRPGADVYDSARACWKAFSFFNDYWPAAFLAATRSELVRWKSPLEPSLNPAIVADACPQFFPTRPPRPSAEDEFAPRDLDLSQLKDATAEDKQNNLREAVKSGKARICAYPEFDNAMKRLVPRRCILTERRLEGGDASWYEGVLASRAKLHRAMLKRFQSMQPEEVELTRRWADGDEMHLGDATDFATDLLRGSTPDDRIYQRKTLNVRSVAALILVDASSSTKDTVNGRSIIEIEKEALALLSSVMHRMGDDFSIAAFNSNGAERVNYNVVKKFGDSWNAAAKAAIAAIEPWSANRDGCAIRHATAELRGTEARTKLLIILSDGVPADPGYGEGDGTLTSDYALEDTRRAILEARRAGIVPFCLTIDLAAKTYVGHLYGDYSFSVLSDIDALPQRLARLYGRLTR